MTSLTLGIEHRQQQGLSPRLQRAVRLLQLSSLDFAQEMQETLGRNPFLELDEDDTVGEAAEETPDGEDREQPFPGEAVKETPEVEGPESPVAERDTDAISGDDPDFDRESWQADGVSSNRRNDGSSANLLETHAGEDSLNEILLRQLHVLPLAARDMAIAEVIIGSLDDDGYLRFMLPDLVDIAGLTPAPSEEELHIALARVQSLEPAGVGARSVQECLRLQLPAIACERKRELADSIITQHLAMLASRDVPGLARTLSCSAAEIQGVLECIRQFDPRPGWRFGASHVQYVTPDVIVKKVRGTWTAALNPAIVPKVRLNQVYAEMFQRNRNAQHSELAAHLLEARWTVSNVEQRFATILIVSQAIISRQRHFLEYGPLAMKPLGLREIADEVGVHESTVSRVTNNKSMATPLGVFELKHFFSRAMATASGGECSATAIRGLINDMIASENPGAPLSDAEIARLLARQGILVARRTVTKYRQLLHIEAFERRRKHA
jgi:RNA polymerase sigma-54 factor